MKIMAKQKLFKTYIYLFTGLLGAGFILMTTGCEVQKVGSTPSQDYIIEPFPGPPAPIDFTGDTTGSLDSTIIAVPPDAPPPELPEVPEFPEVPEVPDPVL